MKTQRFETDSGTVELRRPTFGEMREIGEKVKELMMIPSAMTLLASDTFHELMQLVAVDDDNFQILVNDMDFMDVWTVWQQYQQFARFEDFFGNVEVSHQDSVLARQREQMQRKAKELEDLREHKLLPDDFSLSDAVRDEIKREAQKAQEPSASGSGTPSKKGGKKK